ncbi:cation/H(+) antiporter 15-like [Silene latifolia]|uniref:cation/H(+) antiporter 15-like n=1 Tax=Silene latifolia TaxID=37657 RepID=UPI003D77FD7D
MGIPRMNSIGLKNETVVCHNPTKITSEGIWNGMNPLSSSVPLLLAQLILITLTSKAVEFLLRPLGQASIVAQIVGGLVLGPSALGHVPKIARELFPQRGQITMETIATFGLTVFLFSMGVKMDSSLMFRPEKAAVTIAVSLLVFTFIIPLLIVFLFFMNLNLEPQLKQSLPLLVSSQTLVAFPAIACILAELKIFNTEVGRLAVAVSMFYDVLALGLCAIGFSFAETMHQGVSKSVAAVLSVFGLIFGIVILVRFVLLRFLASEKETSPLDSSSQSTGPCPANEVHVTAIIVMLLLSTLASEMIGQHYFLGPMILGLAVPNASPLGAAVVSKFDTFVSGLLYPTFLAISGLKTDIYHVSIKQTQTAAIVVLSGVVIKIVAVVIPAIYEDVPFQEAFVLSLVMNARGLNELVIYNLVLEDQKISEEQFTLMVISVVLVTATITPFIKFLYHPSRKFNPMRKLTIQHHKKDTELRIVACIHQQDEVPTIVNLLEATNASVETPVSVMVVVLVEVVGSSAAMLLSYRPHRTLEPCISTNNHISNAFMQYERQNPGYVSVQVFTNMSHLGAMHDDISRLAADKRANFLILPFHKQWAIDGSIANINRPIRAMNRKLMEWAPCSLGILIDRGPVRGSLSILNTRSTYRVAVLFIGGSDDIESLAYGARMVRHERVEVTVIRFLLLGRDNSRDRKHGSETIADYRRASAGNERFKYLEELVKDGVGLAESIRNMDNIYDLIIVGKNHENSPILFGLHEWSECPELGVIGDLLASSDAETTASVLVIQQQHLAGSTSGAAYFQTDRDMFIHDEPIYDEPRSGRSSNVSISISIDGSNR